MFYGEAFGEDGFVGVGTTGQGYCSPWMNHVDMLCGKNGARKCLMYDFERSSAADASTSQASVGYMQIISSCSMNMLLHDISSCYDFAFSFSSGTTHHS